VPRLSLVQDECAVEQPVWAEALVAG
jgi:hypothetical protein